MSEEYTAPETVAEAPVIESAELVATEGQAAPETVEAPEAPPVENKAKERLSLRFSELTSQREAARQEATRASEEAAYWRQQALNRQQADEPSHYAEEGGFDPQSIEATVERAVAARLAQNAQTQQVQTLRTTLLESGLDGAALIASGGDVPFTQAMFDALSVSEQPAVVADHLGRNPAEAGRIAALSPVQQGVELARLEVRLASQPRTTNAPPPPSTVGARAVASVDPNSMTFEQYKAARESGKL